MKNIIKLLTLSFLMSFASEDQGLISQEGFIGEIRMFAGNFAPRSWAFCDGQLLAISQNTALFSILGTTYGGDGRTTFALPDLRSRVAVHEGHGPGLSDYRLGEKGGVESVQLTTLNLPAHSHTIPAGGGTVPVADGPPDTNIPGGSYLTTGAATGQMLYKKASGATFTNGTNLNTPSSGSSTTGNTGASIAVPNVQPYNTVNYIICLQGIYPSRS